MRSDKKLLLAGLCTLLLTGAHWPEPLEQPKHLPYRTVNLPQFVKLEQGFEQALKQKQFDKLEAYYEVNKDSAMAVMESDPELGWGAVLMFAPLPQQQDWFLQVPHRFHDLYTADIAEHWLATGQFKLAMINTVHRHAGGNLDPERNSDFSTAPKNAMLAASRAFVRHSRKPLIIQLHGFSQDSRTTDIAREADMILSYGAALSAQRMKPLQKAARCLQDRMEIDARVYPLEVSELGGTRNIVGRDLRNKGFLTQFVHVEISKPLRKKLRNNAPQARQLLGCLVSYL